MIREEYKGNQLVPLTPKHFLPNAKMIRNVVSIGIPGALITVLTGKGFSKSMLFVQSKHYPVRI